MKYFFHTIALLAAAGTFAAMVNPALLQQGTDLVRQGATFLGLELPNGSKESDGEETTEEAQLANFMAQYPSARGQNDSPLPTSVPAIPPPVSTPPPYYPPPPPTTFPAPATPFPIAATPSPPPAPVVEPPAPVIAHDFSNWDSEASIPIVTPPAEDYPTEWTARPPQEPVTSVYAVSSANTPADDAFPAIQQVEPGFAQTRHVVPVTPSQPQQTAVQNTPPMPPPSTTLHTPATLIEDVPVPGTEIAAKVGRQVILMGDILPRLRRASLQIVDVNLQAMPEDKRAEVKPQEIEQFINEFAAKIYPEVLDEQILFALVYSDYDMSMDRATKNAYNDRMGDEFDRNEIPKMMKEFNVDNVAALKRYLEEQLGSSLEKERRLWIREEIVKQWISMSMQPVTRECTHDEMMDFYEKNKARFTSEAKARWQEMTVLFSKYKTEEEARNKIVWMGNQVAAGASFEEIAKANSDGFTASIGGIRDWVTKGSLTSAELEQVIFSQPIGQLSPAIIRNDQGFHIVKVLEREETKVVPFVEAQSTIREMIKRQRAQRHQEEYFSHLRRRFPTVIIKDRIDFKVCTPHTSSGVR